jgi:hypothetical protein
MNRKRKHLPAWLLAAESAVLDFALRFDSADVPFPVATIVSVSMVFALALFSTL